MTDRLEEPRTDNHHARVYASVHSGSSFSTLLKTVFRILNV